MFVSVYLSRSSDGQRSFVDNHDHSFVRNGLAACTKYTFQVTPKFKETLGEPRDVQIETFPDETFLGVRSDTNGIQYSHDNLNECKSVQYITYKMSVVTESGDTKEAILKARASFFELESGVQRFEAEDEWW